ncbi:MAG: hypothetical protein M3P06_01300 [Acidobacteriota bacterium]|nr:hypothetical protein [Acidobacteriota bacterium]
MTTLEWTDDGCYVVDGEEEIGRGDAGLQRLLALLGALPRGTRVTVHYPAGGAGGESIVDSMPFASRIADFDAIVARNGLRVEYMPRF